jgi:hypothetical protein
MRYIGGKECRKTSGGAAMDTAKVSEELYSSALRDFSTAVEQAISTSHAIADRPVDERRALASVLFTRLCVLSVSIVSLCPGSKLSQRAKHWDFSAVASLSRNLFEGALLLFYFAFDDVEEVEWEARLKVMQLHDCLSRHHMFRDFGNNDEDLPAFERQAEELRAVLTNNSYFINLEPSRRKKLLNGDRATILTLHEICEKSGGNWAGHWGLYRFWSAQTHSLPLGFYRSVEQGRGRGVENDAEKAYIGGALAVSVHTLEACSDRIQHLFSGMAKFKGYSFDLSTLQPS